MSVLIRWMNRASAMSFHEDGCIEPSNTPVLQLDSEDKPYPYLATSGAVVLVVDFPELIGTKLISRTPKARRVGKVEKLGP